MLPPPLKAASVRYSISMTLCKVLHCPCTSSQSLRAWLDEDRRRPSNARNERARKPVERFVPVEEPHHEGVALDTATGILCRTWDWHYNSNAPSDATGGLDGLKLCYELYKEDPINSE